MDNSKSNIPFSKYSKLAGGKQMLIQFIANA
jgi:hypothetical protein